ncbi:MAG: hypothetical protein Q9M30_10210 [Mariprofundaceae bacterium]|nr:hypothetical protein [Mariprofundaceae bacterium]
MSDTQAAALLDYHMDTRVARAMLDRLDGNPEDGNAWHYLALAMRAQGRSSLAGAAEVKARRYGTGEKNWHIDLRLAGFVDSNVVVAPDALQLAARDRGDIGARIQLALSGQTLKTNRMHTSWRLSYADMLYQDFSAFAVRHLQGALAQHIDITEQTSIYLGAHGEQAALGGAGLFNGWNAISGLRAELGENTAITVDANFGHRNFLSGFSDYSAWRWKVRHAWVWQNEDAKFMAGFHVGKEQTRSALEAYRLMGISTAGGWRMLSDIGHGALWLEAGAAYEQQHYRNPNNQAFLIRSLTRRDSDIKLLGTLAWKRKQSIIGDRIAETWQWQAGWTRHRSNINTGAVFSSAQSRDWKRWWSEVSIQWHY